MRIGWQLVLAALAAVVCAEAAAQCNANAAQGCKADVVLAWNERLLAIAEAEDGFLTLKGVRTAAMMHVAMHDALNALQPRYAPYAYTARAGGADPIVAVANAAYEVAAHEYPKHVDVLRVELESSIARASSTSAAKQSAATLGRAAAQGILKRREGDGWASEAQYLWQPMGPGVYAEFRDHSGTPQGFVFGAGWASAQPFALRQPDQFRVPPPPAIQSDAYVAAYEEVKEFGRHASASRTRDQTHLALWWKEFVESSHNRLARQLVRKQGTDLPQAARLFALLNMSIMDGYISSFDSKFFYNHWRPYTAIRWAANDGNPRTEADAQWDNTHRHTYPFPSYPSAHGTVCAAAMTVLADTYGDRYTFTMNTPEVASAGPSSPRMRMEPATRSFDSFSAAAMECALSRVYLGIHFRYDSIAGNALGRNVGRFAVEHALTPR